MFSTCCRLLALSGRELAALLAVFALSLPAVTPRIYASDEIQYFAYLRSLWFDHDVSFENEYQYFYDRGVARAEGFHETFLELQTDAGRRPNFGTIGCAILWAPFYAAGDLTARVMRAAGRDVAVDGFSRPYVAAVAYGSAVYGFLALLLSVRAARIVAGPGLFAGMVVWLGTPVLFYTYIAPPYAHACSAFAVAVFVTVWLHARASWSVASTAALGLSAALMAMVREQDVFFAAGPALDFALTALSVRRRVAAAAAGCAAFAAGFLPQLVAYAALNGRPGPSRLVTRKMAWDAPHAIDVLVSTAHGYFFWTPLAALAIVGLAVLAIRGTGDRRRIGTLALVMVALQVYVGGSVESWTVAGAFGQRRFVALTVLLVIGIAALWKHVPSGTARAVTAVALGVCVWWNLALIAQFGTNMMDRKRLDLARNAHTAFVTLPRMAPGLAWRYLFDRSSFYRRSAGER